MSGEFDWDEDIALDLLNAIVLVGITRLSHSGELKSQDQFYGRIVVANRNDGICIMWLGEQGDGEYWLPPTTAGWRRLPPGQYEIVSTGEVVEDPAFVSQWTLTEPPPGFTPEE